MLVRLTKYYCLRWIISHLYIQTSGVIAGLIRAPHGLFLKTILHPSNVHGIYLGVGGGKYCVHNNLNTCNNNNGWYLVTNFIFIVTSGQIYLSPADIIPNTPPIHTHFFFYYNYILQLMKIYI